LAIQSTHYRNFPAYVKSCNDEGIAMSHRFLLSIAGVAFLATGLPAFAHHAFSNEYDESKPITLEGVVTRIDWENPHVHYTWMSRRPAARWSIGLVKPAARTGWRGADGPVIP